MVNALPPKADAPTWRWRIEPSRLREAAKLRRADPNNFDSAVLTYFGLGGRDDGAIIEKMRAHPIVRAMSSWKKKMTAGSWGAIVRMPAAISQMSGV